ncbi:Fic-family protein [Gordonia rhizosphera NBRC 16068]|uniref:Fic-family protein n=2 Tax=Gordonia rhizosphera TaxID=83341 RepID=K6WNW9_9ACTN|nr:Fic-family protein [Gordonia rhizosphera NBRC 16068]
MRVRDLPGTRLAHPVTGAVTYSPPEGRDVIIEKLRQWEEFVHADDGLDPLIRMAVAHYQFEAIHPIDAIRDLQDRFAVRARAATRDGSDIELLAVLFEQPYCRISTVRERCAVSRPTATNWLTALAEAGLLEDVKIGRDRLFINREMLDVLRQDEGD